MILEPWFPEDFRKAVREDAIDAGVSPEDVEKVLAALTDNFGFSGFQIISDTGVSQWRWTDEQGFYLPISSAEQIDDPDRA